MFAVRGCIATTWIFRLHLHCMNSRKLPGTGSICLSQLVAFLNLLVSSFIVRYLVPLIHNRKKKYCSFWIPFTRENMQHKPWKHASNPDVVESLFPQVSNINDSHIVSRNSRNIIESSFTTSFLPKGVNQGTLVSRLLRRAEHTDLIIFIIYNKHVIISCKYYWSWSLAIHSAKKIIIIVSSKYTNAVIIVVSDR